MNAKKARQLALLKQAKEHHEAMTKKIGAEIQRIGNELYNEFIDDGVESYRLLASFNGEQLFMDGKDRLLRPEVKYKPSVPSEQLNAFHEWMRAEGFGDLIKESIHHATLTSWVDKRKQENKELPPEDLLKVFTLEGTKITRAPKRTK